MSEEQVVAEMVPIEQLVPWGSNPRSNDGRPVEEVAASIQRFGFAAPIIARKENSEVIAGHTRLKAAMQLGLDVVPVRFMDISAEEAHALAVLDNRLVELPEWDLDGLANMIDTEIDLEGLGWNQEELRQLLGVYDVEPVDGLPDLDPDDAELVQWTFTVTRNQKKQIEAAVEHAKETNTFVSINTNSNGNAIAHISEVYLANKQNAQ